jgi:hypothetical protein
MMDVALTVFIVGLAVILIPAFIIGTILVIAIIRGLFEIGGMVVKDLKPEPSLPLTEESMLLRPADAPDTLLRPLGGGWR